MDVVNEYDQLVKVLLIGESGVGKTCVLQKFSKGDFVVNHLTTIAIDFKMRVVEVDGVKLKMQIWDTAGQERFDTLTTSFFKSAQGIMVCYSITDENSFQSVNKWIRQIRNYAPKDVKVIMLGNKSDLPNDRKVRTQTAKEVADQFGTGFYEVSAFNGDNIEQAFIQLATEILSNLKQQDQVPNPNLDFLEQNKSGCCGN